EEILREMALQFTQAVLRESECNPLPEVIAHTEVLAFCRTLASLSPNALRDNSVGKDTVHGLAWACAQALSRNTIRLGPPAGTLSAPPHQRSSLAPQPSTPGEAFERLDSRIAAGEAILQAKDLEDHGNINAAEGRFQAALRVLPNDSDAL